jgi:hypothetical protein
VAGAFPLEASWVPTSGASKFSPRVTTQDFIKFWGKIFVFILLEMIEISQGFKTF